MVQSVNFRWGTVKWLKRYYCHIIILCIEIKVLFFKGFSFSFTRWLLYFIRLLLDLPKCFHSFFFFCLNLYIILYIRKQMFFFIFILVLFLFFFCNINVYLIRAILFFSTKEVFRTSNCQNANHGRLYYVRYLHYIYTELFYFFYYVIILNDEYKYILKCLVFLFKFQSMENIC